MALADQIQKPTDGPLICTIAGEPGMGKTTLAAAFPKPLFIRAEDGLQSVPSEMRPDALPLVRDVEMLREQLKMVLSEEHGYKTLVIDSVTALEQMFHKHIVDNDPNKPRSINQAMGGYGAGLAAVAALHASVRQGCGKIAERRGMHIVFLAHADTETLDLPDREPYTRYSLRLGKKSLQPYVDDVQLIGYVKLETILRGDSDKPKKAVSTGSRVLDCTAKASSIAKNRFGIEEELPFVKGENPLVGYVPTLSEG